MNYTYGRFIANYCHLHFAMWKGEIKHDFLLGPVHADSKEVIDQLEAMNFVGVYRAKEI